MAAILKYLLLGLLILLWSLYASAQTSPYPWLSEYNPAENIFSRISPPPGFARAEVSPGTFADWLQNLPLKHENPPVLLFNGTKKANQDAHFAVLDLDVGDKDLQQCADAVIRLRAEYLYQIRDYDAISFHFTSGDRVDFSKWMQGYRPAVKNNRVKWEKKVAPDSSYAALREYLETIFTYSGTLSLSRELQKVSPISDLQIGDVFIQGGSPGHAVIVVDLAINHSTGEKAFLLAQSYMPAQEMHLLKNPIAANLSPWYRLDFGELLTTPEWTFKQGDLGRFKTAR